MEIILAQMGDVMQEIINEIKGGVQFIDHATSLLCVIASNVWNICLSEMNEILHSSMVFHHINDGLNNSMHYMKDWHKTMVECVNILRKRIHEYKKIIYFHLYFLPY